MSKKVIALGFFDGVHLGHAALLSRTVEIAEARGFAPAVATFDRHPSGESLISTLDERKSLISMLFGISDIICFEFNSDFRRIEPHAFIDLLVSKHNAAHLVAGYDYRFGRGGTGDASLLLAEVARRDIGCDIVDAVTLDGEVVSSTRIREFLAKGDTTAAERFLGHTYTPNTII